MDGRLEVNEWKGKDEKTRRDVLIIAENHTFCEGKKEKKVNDEAFETYEGDDDMPF